MNGRNQAQPVQRTRKTFLWPLAIAVAAGICATVGFSPAHAQATSASIFGWGPAGEKVQVHSTTGLHRHATVNDSGRYTLRALPLGTYSVSLEKDGKLVDTRSNIALTIGRNAEIDFACPNDKCEK